MEVECAVLEGIDGGPPEASLPGQVVVDPGSSFYDFQAKYLADGDVDDDPRADPRGGRRRGQAAGLRGVRGHLLRGPGPG